MGFIATLVGNGAIKTETVGKVYREQMYILDSREWILRRISPICENCNDNKHYNIKCTSKKYIAYLIVPYYVKTYKIACPNCGESIKLELKEYLIIEPFIKVNRKYEQGKISQQEYNYKILKISKKYKKKYN